MLVFLLAPVLALLRADESGQAATLDASGAVSFGGLQVRAAPKRNASGAKIFGGLNETKTTFYLEWQGKFDGEKDGSVLNLKFRQPTRDDKGVMHLSGVWDYLSNHAAYLQAPVFEKAGNWGPAGRTFIATMTDKSSFRENKLTISGTGNYFVKNEASTFEWMPVDGVSMIPGCLGQGKNVKLVGTKFRLFGFVKDLDENDDDQFESTGGWTILGHRDMKLKMKEREWTEITTDLLKCFK